MSPPYAAVQYEAKRRPVSSADEGASKIMAVMEKSEPEQ